MLHGAGLGSEYWSYAITHAVYLINRQPHSALKMTPYEALTGHQPQLNHLRTFGSYKPNERKAKLDMNNATGIFLHFGGSDKMIVVRDDTTGKEKYVRHAGFHEVHMGALTKDKPPFAKSLIEAGYSNEDTEIDLRPPTSSELKIQLLSSNGKIPIKGSDKAADYDLYSANTVTIKPGEQQEIVPTDIAVVECSTGSYLRIAPRSGLAAKKMINVHEGVIDADYRGNTKVALINHSTVPVTILKGDRGTAQAIGVTKIEHPAISVVASLSTSHRGTKGFGSTDKHQYR